MKTGDKIPDFALINQDGNEFKLSDVLGKQIIVLFFYPKDNTAGCTAEACAFRDAYQDFTEAGVKVIGISSDGVESHRGFADKHRLPFTLLSDPQGKVRKQLKVPGSLLGLLPGRVTYVVDKQGKVRHTFNSQLRPEAHVKEALEVIERISKEN